MRTMVRRFPFRLCIVVASFGLIFSSLAVSAQQNTSKRGRKYKTPPPTARIEVTVVRDSNGKPIENAAVIFHPMEGEKDKGNMELKTNEDGKTIIDVLPIGDTVRMQIIAKGFQTFGDDYKSRSGSDGDRYPDEAPRRAVLDLQEASRDLRGRQGSRCTFRAVVKGQAHSSARRAAQSASAEVIDALRLIGLQIHTVSKGYGFQ